MRPTKIQLPFKMKVPVLALGGQAKNTLCFAKGNFAFLSRQHADLSNPKDYFSFEHDVRYFLKKHPKIIACDLHPEYLSTKFASSLRATSYKLRAIQHHHAHIASCMAENSLKNQRVLGVAFDGTGLGSNQGLWGAEFFLCDYQKFIRVAHLKEIPLLGGERAILEPWRVAAAWLGQREKAKFLRLNLAFTKKIKPRQWQVLQKMQQSGFNSPLTSSMGRLFDAVASLVLARQRAGFEAELAIAFEKLAQSAQIGKAPNYPFQVKKKQNQYILDPLPMFKGILADLQKRKAAAEIAYGFHCSVAAMVKEVCLILRRDTRLNKVVLSGGVWQNKLLLLLSLDLLCRQGFVVFTHHKLSCNDSGIALGEAVIAGLAR